MSMSDPTEGNEANPHPASSHRTPRQIAKDEAGPVGRKPTEAAAVDPESKREVGKKEDKERRAAVQKSAHAAK